MIWLLAYLAVGVVVMLCSAAFTAPDRFAELDTITVGFVMALGVLLWGILVPLSILGNVTLAISRAARWVTR